MLNSSKQLLIQSESQLDHGRLMSLINSLSDGFLAIDESGIIELSNSVALDMLNTNSLEGKTLSGAMPLIDASGGAKDLLSLAQAAGASFSVRDYHLKYRDGLEVTLYINVSPVQTAFGTGDKSGFVILFRDITREKNVEDERDEFISVASHELRNPVAVAEGSISNALLLAERSRVPDNIMEILKSAHGQILFISNLVNDLAMVSRADKENFAKISEEFDPAEVVLSVQKDYAQQAQKKNLEIKVEAGALPKIHGSRLYTREVLQNFITNSLKYTEKGSITIKAVASGNVVDFSVSDTGIGIDAEEQRKLFTKFFRSQDTRVRQISGTGLGLYVAAKLAELMGGSITMESELNQGSSFTLHLPTAPVDQNTAPDSTVVA